MPLTTEEADRLKAAVEELAKVAHDRGAELLRLQATGQRPSLLDARWAAVERRWTKATGGLKTLVDELTVQGQQCGCGRVLLPAGPDGEVVCGCGREHLGGERRLAEATTLATVLSGA